MSDPASSRRVAGFAILISGLVMAVAGAYLLLQTEWTLGGGIIFGAGILDLVAGFFFLRG